MADEKLTALGTIPGIASGDLLYIVDISDTTDDPAGSSKKVLLSTIWQVSNDTSPTLGGDLDADGNAITKAQGVQANAAATTTGLTEQVAFMDVASGFGRFASYNWGSAAFTDVLLHGNNTQVRSDNNSISFTFSGTQQAAFIADNFFINHTFKVKERSAAIADTAGFGQLWVKDDAPCELYYTDDTGQDVQITSNGSVNASGGGGVDAKPGAFEATGSTNISNTADTTIALNTEVYDPDTNYSNSAGEITVTDAGYYYVAVNVPINDDGTAGATRGRQYAWLERDQGTSTWITVNHIRGQVYEREASGGTGLHMAGIVQLSASEVIRARIRSSSTVDTSTESGEASLSIHKIRAA